MLTAIFFFLVGFALLIVCGDWFVDGSVGVAKRFHVPELLIGATIVSIGTTLPEVMVSASAAAQNHSEIAYGNAIGSIICNTALIAALTAAIRPSEVDRASLRLPTVFFFIAAALYAGIAYTSGSFTRLSGILLLAIFVVYFALSVRNALAEKVFIDEASEETPSVLKSLLLIAIGAAGIAIGANLLVENGTIIAAALGVPESVIALTFVALGTSLPELTTAITALVKGHSALSLGNVVGANLFNLVLVSGTAITIRPFTLPQEKTLLGMNASLAVDVPLMLLVMMILTLPALRSGKLHRWQGVLLLALYFGFCVFQFAL